MRNFIRDFVFLRLFCDHFTNWMYGFSDFARRFSLICSDSRSFAQFLLTSALISSSGVSVHPTIIPSLCAFSSDRCLDYFRLIRTRPSLFHSGPYTTSECGLFLDCLYEGYAWLSLHLFSGDTNSSFLSFFLTYLASR